MFTPKEKARELEVFPRFVQGHWFHRSLSLHSSSDESVSASVHADYGQKGGGKLVLSSDLMMGLHAMACNVRHGLTLNFY